MKRLRDALRAAVLGLFSFDLPLAHVLHNDRPVYVAEGYGGRPIDHFPPHAFFQLFAAGKREEAAAAFSAWYREQFRRYADVEKRVGGMQNGTLHRLLLEVCREAGLGSADPRAPDPRLFEEAIARRVKQRFELLESIRDDGYRAERGKPVLGIWRGDDVVLLGGHHRAAALSVLGSDVLPAVAVFPRPVYRALKRVGML
jgi:hypothetical protein